MNAAFLFMVASTFPLPQDTEEARRAIEIVRKAEGKVVIDNKARVIAVNL